MKKLLIILLIAVIVFTVASCEWDSIHYCPYCSSSNITQNDDGTYKCNRDSCGVTFGAKQLPSAK
ncbi:MAG: hypothetical protein FWB95_02120 [Treponema sp.]|nr:hypothetical protein [Treponema sp.]